MNRKTLATFALMSLAIEVSAQDGAVMTQSPDGRLVVATYVDGGRPTYAVTYDGRTVIEPSRLGIVADFGDLTTGMTMDSIAEMRWEDAYTLDKIKKSDVSFEANRTLVWFSDKQGLRLCAEVAVEDNSIGIR